MYSDAQKTRARFKSVGMDKQSLRQFVKKEIQEYEYVIPEDTVGNPMKTDWVLNQLQQATDCIVDPYLEKMWLQDTYEQIKDKKNKITQQLWVVAKDSNFVVFYDSTNKEFGLAHFFNNEFITLGTRGDFVGCFMAR